MPALGRGEAWCLCLLTPSGFNPSVFFINCLKFADRQSVRAVFAHRCQIFSNRLVQLLLILYSWRPRKQLSFPESWRPLPADNEARQPSRLRLRSLTIRALTAPRNFVGDCGDFDWPQFQPLRSLPSTDDLNGRLSFRLVVRTLQSLAINGNDFAYAKVDLLVDPPEQTPLKLAWLNQAQHTSEGILAESSAACVVFFQFRLRGHLFNGNPRSTRLTQSLLAPQVALPRLSTKEASTRATIKAWSPWSRASPARGRPTEERATQNAKRIKNSNSSDTKFWRYR